MEFQVGLFDAEPEATTSSIADTDSIVCWLERDIYGITSNEQMLFRKELFVRLIKFEAGWQAIATQDLRKTIQQRVGFPTIHFMS
jgi:hypothetical protein